MLEHGTIRGEQADAIGEVVKSAGSLSLPARDMLNRSLAALVECGASLSVRLVHERADIVCALLMSASDFARAVRIVVEQLRADGECPDHITDLVDTAREFARPDFEGAFESVSRRFGPPRQHLFLKVAVYSECGGVETWTVDPANLEDHPGWITADEEDRGAYRAMDAFDCLALSLTALNASIRPGRHENDFSF